MKWTNMTPEQMMVLTMTEKLAKLEGMVVGMYYAAEMTDNKDAQRLAWDLKGDIKFVLDSILKLADGQGNDEATTAKLQVSITALRKLAKLGNGDAIGNSHGNVLATQALREMGVDP